MATENTLYRHRSNGTYPHALTSKYTKKPKNINRNYNTIENPLAKEGRDGHVPTTYKRKSNGWVGIAQNKTAVTGEHEIDILDKLKGCNGVMKIEIVYKQDGKYTILTEFKKGGDLISFINAHVKTKIDDETICNIMRQICKAIQCVHEKGICHLDLKPNNVVIDKSYKITIIDFETARTVDENGLCTIGDKIGTLNYMSPELKAIVKKAIVKKAGDPLNFKFNGFAVDKYAIARILEDISKYASTNPDLYTKLITTIKTNRWQYDMTEIFREIDRTEEIFREIVRTKYKYMFDEMEADVELIEMINSCKKLKNSTDIKTCYNKTKAYILTGLPDYTKEEEKAVDLFLHDKGIHQLEQLGGKKLYRKYTRTCTKKQRKHRTKKQRKQRTRRA